MKKEDMVSIVVSGKVDNLYTQVDSFQSFHCFHLEKVESVEGDFGCESGGFRPASREGGIIHSQSHLEKVFPVIPYTYGSGKPENQN